MIAVSALSKAFRSNTNRQSESVLDNVSFTVKPGEIVSITGKSGAGKSTIARIICGTLPPDSGEVRYGDELLLNAKQRFPRNRRRDIQLIPQQPIAALDPRQRIGDAIAEPMLCHGIVKTRKAAKERALALLDNVWLPPEIALRLPSQISGGQAQRSVIARALGLSPKVLIADEATSMLDIPAQAQVVQLFQKLVQENGVSLLLISHDQPLVNALSNRIFHLEKATLSQTR